MTSWPSPVTLAEQHLPSLAALEQHAHPAGWTERALRDELHASGAILRGCFSSTSLVAYAAWRVMVDELWLLNLTVAVSHRRGGLGRVLLEDGRRLASNLRLPELWLEVRAHNEPALRLYRAAGFVEQGRRPQYYPGVPPALAREDAIVMMTPV
ncbi:MAG: GNAT family N-acetyltransferase [Myxococcota bacterium]